MQGRRLVLGLVLAAALAGLFVHYGATVDTHDRYPDNEKVATAYDSHVGETVQVAAVVRDRERRNATMTVALRGFESSGTLSVRGADRTIPPGGSAHVLGTLRPGRVVVAEDVVAVNPRPWSEPYKYAVSVVGAALVLVGFFREWRIDVGAVAFEVRDDG